MDKLATYDRLLQRHPLWTKEAAPRQIKILRDLVRRGRVDEARELSQRLSDAGVLKKSLAGTPIMDLGGGAEGPAFLTVGASDAPVPMSVRKMFDRDAATFDKSMLAEKFNMFRRAKNDPNVATVFSPKIRKGSKGTPYYQMEYVDGGDMVGRQWPDRFVQSTAGEGSTDISKAVGLMAGSEFGMGKKKLLTDVLTNPANVRVTRDGVLKLTDFIPTSARNAARSVSASDPSSRFVQKNFLNLPPRSTAGSLEDVQTEGARMMQMLQNSPTGMRKAEKLGPRAIASQYRNLFGNPNLAVSDWVPRRVRGQEMMALRPADPQRTLKGM